MSEVDLLERLLEAERKAADALARLAIIQEQIEKTEAKRAKNRARMQLVRAQRCTGAHTDAQSRTESPSPQVSSSPPTPPIITSFPPTPVSSASQKGRGQVAPWMGRVKDIWDVRYPAASPPPGTAKALRPLFERFPEDAAVRLFEEYLRDTPSQFLNFGKFASTAGSDPNPPPTKQRAMAGDVTRRNIEAMIGKVVA